jgi:hypothetical protein
VARDAAGLAAIGRAVYGALVEQLQLVVDGSLVAAVPIDLG